MFSDGNPREFYGMEDDRYRYWTVEQNKMFENALAVFPESTPDRWHQIAMLIPGKSPWEVQVHYEELVRDLSEIESGRRELPEYGDRPGSSKSRGDGGGSGSMSERKKGIPWTEEEHKLFLIGLQKYGKGDWRSISRNSVVSRTPTQVASHAQKYYLRLNSVKKDKKRSSIHDITTADQPQASASSPTGMMSSQNSPTSSSGYSQGMEFVGMADDPHSAFFGQQDIYGHFYPN